MFVMSTSPLPKNAAFTPNDSVVSVRSFDDVNSTGVDVSHTLDAWPCSEIVWITLMPWLTVIVGFLLWPRIW